MNRRPRLQIVAPSASPEEAAAVAAALERFMREHAPALDGASDAPPAAPGSAWKRAALDEGVRRQPDAPAAWE